MSDFDPRKWDEFQRRYADFIGKSIIDGLIRPDLLPGIGDLLQDHGQGGRYRQSGGRYRQSGGGSHFMCGDHYSQSTEGMPPR